MVDEANIYLCTINYKYKLQYKISQKLKVEPYNTRAKALYKDIHLCFIFHTYTDTDTLSLLSLSVYVHRSLSSPLPFQNDLLLHHLSL